MCEQDMFLVVFDRNKKKLIKYCSSEDFDHRVVSHLIENHENFGLKTKDYSNGSLQYDDQDVNLSKYTINPIESITPIKDMSLDEIIQKYT